eukprot:scaffold183114_cov22-Prasinocladus_malaysianus.AAC.1
MAILIRIRLDANSKPVSSLSPYCTHMSDDDDTEFASCRLLTHGETIFGRCLLLCGNKCYYYLP